MASVSAIGAVLMTQYDPGHNKGTESRFVFGWEGGVVGWGVGGGGGCFVLFVSAIFVNEPSRSFDQVV